MAPASYSTEPSPTSTILAILSYSLLSSEALLKQKHLQRIYLQEKKSRSIHLKIRQLELFGYTNYWKLTVSLIWLVHLLGFSSGTLHYHRKKVYCHILCFKYNFFKCQISCLVNAFCWLQIKYHTKHTFKQVLHWNK